MGASKSDWHVFWQWWYFTLLLRRCVSFSFPTTTLLSVTAASIENPARRWDVPVDVITITRRILPVSFPRLSLLAMISLSVWHYTSASQTPFYLLSLPGSKCRRALRTSFKSLRVPLHQITRAVMAEHGLFYLTILNWLRGEDNARATCNPSVRCWKRGNLIESKH